MKKRNLFVRITAIILCAIMVLGVFTAAFYAFAADASVTPPAPATGSPDNTWLILVAVVAILAIVACVVIPKMKKK